MQPEDIRFLDWTNDVLILQRRLPHWAQAGALCFVTWRAADSLPQSVMCQMEKEIDSLLRSEGLNPQAEWKSELYAQHPAIQDQVRRKLLLTQDKFLDKGFGKCLLADPRCAKAVVDSLLYFDEDRYFVTDLVVMPNHVHFIAAFANGEEFLKQCTDLKRYSARQINRIAGRSGEFWQVDQFDHLIRNERQFRYFAQYIAENPRGLSEDSFFSFSKQIVIENACQSGTD